MNIRIPQTQLFDFFQQQRHAILAALTGQERSAEGAGAGAVPQGQQLTPSATSEMCDAAPAQPRTP